MKLSLEKKVPVREAPGPTRMLSWAMSNADPGPRLHSAIPYLQKEATFIWACGCPSEDLTVGFSKAEAGPERVLGSSEVERRRRLCLWLS